MTMSGSCMYLHAGSSVLDSWMYLHGCTLTSSLQGSWMQLHVLYTLHYHLVGFLDRDAMSTDTTTAGSFG